MTTLKLNVEVNDSALVRLREGVKALSGSFKGLGSDINSSGSESAKKFYADTETALAKVKRATTEMARGATAAAKETNGAFATLAPTLDKIAGSLDRIAGAMERQAERSTRALKAQTAATVEATTATVALSKAEEQAAARVAAAAAPREALQRRGGPYVLGKTEAVGARALTNEAEFQRVLQAGTSSELGSLRRKLDAALLAVGQPGGNLAVGNKLGDFLVKDGEVTLRTALARVAERMDALGNQAGAGKIAERFRRSQVKELDRAFKEDSAAQAAADKFAVRFRRSQAKELDRAFKEDMAEKAAADKLAARFRRSEIRELERAFQEGVAEQEAADRIARRYRRSQVRELERAFREESASGAQRQKIQLTSALMQGRATDAGYFAKLDGGTKDYVAQVAAEYRALGKGATAVAEVRRLAAAEHLRMKGEEQKADRLTLSNLDQIRARLEALRVKAAEASQAMQKVSSLGKDPEGKYKLSDKVGQTRLAALAAHALEGGASREAVIGRFGTSATALAQSQGFRSLSSELGRLEEAHRRAAEANKFHAEQVNALHSGLRGMSGTLGGLWLTYGKYAAVTAAAAGATAVVAQSLKKGVEFDYQAQFTQALGASEGKGLDKEIIKKDLMERAKGTTFSALELAESLRTMEQAGIDAAQGLNLVTTAAQVALVAEADVKTATEGMVGALDVFQMRGKTAEETEKSFKRIADVAGRVAQSTTSNLGEVLAAFKNVTGASTAFGASLEMTATLIGKLGEQNIRGSQAGTFTRNFYEDVFGQGSRFAQAYRDQLGVKQYNPGQDDPVKYIDDLVKKVRELDGVSQVNLIEKLTDERGRRLMRDLVADTETLAASIARLDTEATGSLKRVIDALEGNAKLELIEGVKRGTDALTQALQGSEDAIGNVGKTMQKVFTDPTVLEGLTALVKGVALLAEGAAKAAGEYAKLLALATNPQAATKPDEATSPRQYLKQGAWSTFTSPGFVGGIPDLVRGLRAAAGPQPRSQEVEGQIWDTRPGYEKVPGFGLPRLVATEPKRSLADPRKLQQAARDAEGSALERLRGVQARASSEYQKAVEAIDRDERRLRLRQESSIISQGEYETGLIGIEEKRVEAALARQAKIQAELDKLAGQATSGKGSERMRQALATAKAEADGLVESARNKRLDLLDAARIKVEAVPVEGRENLAKLDASARDRIEAAEQSARLARVRDPLDAAGLSARLQQEVEIRQLKADLEGKMARAAGNPDLVSAYQREIAVLEERRQVLLDTAEAAARLQEELSRTPQAGLDRFLKQVADGASNTGAVLETGLNMTLDATVDSLTSLATTGKANFKEFSSALLKELARMAMRQAILTALTKMAQAFAGGVEGQGDGGGVSVSSPGNAGMHADGYHSGGIVGEGRTFSRAVSASTFYGAPRYHSGGVAGEVPAILQRGEGVFTQAQMRNLAPVGRSSGGLTIQQSFTVTVTGNDKQTGKEQGEQISRELAIQMEAVTMRVIQREKHHNGALAK